MRAFFLFVLVFLVPLQAFACALGRKEYIAPVDELISRTDHIALVQAVSSKFIPYPPCHSDTHEMLGPYCFFSGIYYPVQYELKITEVIKGELGEFARIGGQQHSRPALNSDLDRKDAFWEDNAGRLYSDSDCQIYPDFILGAYYLAFIDKPYHRKSFEYLGGDPDKFKDDKWLLYVKDKTK